MTTRPTVITPDEARAYYDRFGKKQDSQGFYEDPALDELIAQAAFEQSASVFEFGCGTGKLAARLLRDHLPPRATYLGCDVSPVMVDLATRRLAPFGERATLVCSGGAIKFPLADHAVERVVSTYVLDILAEEDIAAFFVQARRVLKPQGRLMLASLTGGVTLPSRIVSALWAAVFRLRPRFVGGCRPVHLLAHVDPTLWEILHRKVLTPFGIPSEVLVLGTGADP
jgi:ubiquinone/menaquinone biosynthesis C-methylase UbiE